MTVTVNPQQVLSKGQSFIAPEDGVFLDRAEFNKIIKALEELQLLRMKVSMLESLDAFMKEQVVIYQDALKTSEKLIKTHWYDSKALWFLVGAITTKALWEVDKK